MTNRQAILENLIKEQLHEVKVGLIIKGIEDIHPNKIIQTLAQELNQKLYSSVVGYEHIEENNDLYCISNHIERSVQWRSEPDKSGKILVFIKSTDTVDKLHSLEELDIITTRDLSNYLIKLQIEKNNPEPVKNFWKAMLDESDYYPFELIEAFINAIDEKENTISNSLWILNLLCDKHILDSKVKPQERIKRNRELIVKIGQLSEVSRKKLSHSLVVVNKKDKLILQNTYKNLQKYFKYGEKKILKEMDLEIVEQLFSATKKQDPDNNKKKQNDDDVNKPVKQREFDDTVADVVVSGDESKIQELQDIYEYLKNRYENEDDNGTEIPSNDELFGGRNIVLDNLQVSPFRKLIGTVCSQEVWGGLIKTSEKVLKDIVSTEYESFSRFNPDSTESCLFYGNGNEKTTIFDLMCKFDSLLSHKNTRSFFEIIKDIKEHRSFLSSKIDLLMYQPILAFGIDKEIREHLYKYIETWAELYKAFCEEENEMRAKSSESTLFIGHALLNLDILFIHTANEEWKGILLPLHPLYLWRYAEIFKNLKNGKDIITDED